MQGGRHLITNFNTPYFVTPLTDLTSPLVGDSAKFIASTAASKCTNVESDAVREFRTPANKEQLLARLLRLIPEAQHNIVRKDFDRMIVSWSNLWPEIYYNRGMNFNFGNELDQLNATFLEEKATEFTRGGATQWQYDQLDRETMLNGAVPLNNGRLFYDSTNRECERARDVFRSHNKIRYDQIAAHSRPYERDIDDTLSQPYEVAAPAYKQDMSKLRARARDQLPKKWWTK